MPELEEMSEFFTARADGYDEHMLNEVGGCGEAYEKMAALVPVGTRTLLDLGCGTGLELDGIFKQLPDVEATGIDLTRAMLDRLETKYRGKKLRLIHGSYFDIDLGDGKFDCAVSFQTMHHFSRDKKTALYKKLKRALTSGGVYIECDYMVQTVEEETLYFSEYERLRRDKNLADGVFYHYDTPCTVSHQIESLKAAGFTRVEQVFRVENTTILTATA